MEQHLGTYMVTCPFCRHIVAIEVQSEDIDRIITVTCEKEPRSVFGVGCGRSFRSYCYVKVRTGCEGIEPFTVVKDNPPRPGEKDES